MKVLDIVNMKVIKIYSRFQSKIFHVYKNTVNAQIVKFEN